MIDVASRRPSVRPLASVLLSVVVVAALPATAAAFDLTPSDSANRLDQTYVDLAFLEPVGADDAPRLLAIDAFPPAADTARLLLLQRDRAWIEVDEETLDLGAIGATGLGTPWVVGLTPTTFALLATSAAADRTVVQVIRTDGGPGGASIEAGATRLVGVAIDAAGAADVDGDGQPELLLGSARTVRQGGTCQGSTVRSYDASTLVPVGEITVPEVRLAGGVIGRFDEVPGDDILAYGHANCPAGPDTPGDASLMAINLIDGTRSLERPTPPEAGPILGSPVRLDVDGTGTHEAMAISDGSLAILDPGDGWSATTVLGEDGPVPGPPGLPLGGGSDFGTDPAARIAWLGPNGFSTSRVTRDDAGELSVEPPTVVDPELLGPGRRISINGQLLRAVLDMDPPTAWIGALGDGACADLLISGARFVCDDGFLSPGAAWIGTRPLGTIGTGSRQRLLVASGMEWLPEDGLPRTPDPWAAAPAGWWRHGPSGPFSLAELRSADATYYKDFPNPRATLERTTHADASTTIPGFTGSRLFVRVTAETEDAPSVTDPGVVGSPNSEILPRRANDLFTSLRIPVPPGLESGRDGAGVNVPLGDVTFPDGSRADRWSVAVVPVNDWGEIGPAHTGSLVRDALGPFVVVDAPFQSPVWPLSASIPGSAEPGSVVRVGGIGPIELDRRGRFTIETTLAPWPQTLVVTATDPSGNETVREISVVGGVDYRRFPWPVIAGVAVLLLVGLSGLVGSRWRRNGSDGAPVAGRGIRAYAFDDGPVAEIEELPPGGGLS